MKAPPPNCSPRTSLRPWRSDGRPQRRSTAPMKPLDFDAPRCPDPQHGPAGLLPEVAFGDGITSAPQGMADACHINGDWLRLASAG